jgi:O-antigen/teichoic acid export membrane protein
VNGDAATDSKNAAAVPRIEGAVPPAPAASAAPDGAVPGDAEAAEPKVAERAAPAAQKRRGAKEFIADNAIVALAMLIGKLRGIITLPLVVGAIGTEGYGLWSQLLAFVTLLAFIVSWNLHLPLIRFIAQDRHAAPRIFSTVMVTEMGLAAAGAVVLFPMSSLASQVLLGDPTLGKHLAVGGALVFFNNVRLVNLNVYRAYDRFLVRSVLDLVASAVELGAIIVVLLKTHDLFYALVAMAAWSAVVAAFSTWHASRLTGIGRPSKTIALRALAYSAPLLPVALSLWMLDRVDRFFIGYYLGKKAVGIYSASYALGGLVIQAQVPFQMTLFPKVAQLWDTDRAGAKKYIELSNKFFLTLAIPFVVASAVIAPQLLKKLGNEEISADSAVLTVLVAAGVALYGVSVMQVQVLHGAKRTGVQGTLSLAGAGLNVVLNVVLLPWLGVLGAAIATFVSYAATCAAFGLVARRHLSISYFPVYLLKCLVASLVMLVPMAALVARGTAGLAGAIAAGVPVYFAALVLLRAFDADEIDLARRAWSKIRRRTPASVTSR